MVVALVRPEPESFPKSFASRTGIDGDQSTERTCPVEQCVCEHSAEALATKRRANIKAAHAWSIDNDRIDGETANSDKVAGELQGKQNFSGALEARRSRPPIRRKPSMNRYPSVRASCCNASNPTGSRSSVTASSRATAGSV